MSGTEGRVWLDEQFRDEWNSPVSRMSSDARRVTVRVRLATPEFSGPGPPWVGQVARRGISLGSKGANEPWAQRPGPEGPRPAGTSARSSSDVRLRQSEGYFHTRRNSFADTTSRHCAPAVPRCSPATSWTHQVTPRTSRKIRASRDDGGPASLGTAADALGTPSSGGPGRASNGKCSRSEDDIGQPSSAGGMNPVIGRAGNYAPRGRGREQ